MARRNRKFGNVRRMPSGRFQARFTLPDGSLQSAPSTFETYDEAETWLASVRLERSSGTWVDARSGRVLFDQFVTLWLQTTVANRPSTQVRDEGYLERYLLPTFATTPLGAIDNLAVKSWVAQLLADGLAPATVTKAGQILSKILDEAVAAKRIATNPCKGVRFPRDPNPREMMIIGPAEITALVDAMDERYRSLVLLGCYGGLRIGEMLGLNVADVDPLRRTVSVQRTLVEVEGYLHVHAPKTKAGRRTVPIPGFVAEALAATMGGHHPEDILFPAPKGGPVRLAGWRQRFWRPAIAAVGLEEFRVHDMRHTAISMWVAAGVDPRKVAGWAGHASVVTVLDRYAHVRPLEEEPAMALLDRVGREAQEARPGTVSALGR